MSGAGALPQLGRLVALRVALSGRIHGPPSPKGAMIGVSLA